MEDWLRILSAANDPFVAADYLSGNVARGYRSGRFAILTMPVLYPSGSEVVCGIEIKSEKYRLNDQGGAYRELELRGLDKQFTSIASTVINEIPINLENGILYIDSMPMRLTNSVTLLANISAQVAFLGIERYGI